MWFDSHLLNNGSVDEDVLQGNPLYRNNVDDFINLNVTKENYMRLVELCNFLMVENPDDLIDKIVQVHDYDYSVIYDFEDLYKYYSRRIAVFETKESLKEAIVLYNKDHVQSFHTYGFSSFWNVSNVTDMNEIFLESQFNGDISRWDVSNVKYMIYMFCESQFNGDISKWDVSNVTNMSAMFSRSEFNGDISDWDVSNVRNMSEMFEKSQFNGDISKWDMSNELDMSYMFPCSIPDWDVFSEHVGFGMI